MSVRFEFDSVSGRRPPQRARAAWARRLFVMALGGLVLAALGACAAPDQGGPPAFDPISSTFDTDTEGWTSSEPIPPAWQAPGYLQLADGGPDWYFAIAPSAFHGDWTGAGEISLDVLADAAGVTYPVRVVLTGAGSTLYHEFGLSELAAGEWRSLQVALVASAWRVFTGEETEGPVVDAATLDDVLAEIDDFRIRIDLNDGYQGDEINGIDDVLVE